jgi:hypothetical protein
MVKAIKMGRMGESVRSALGGPPLQALAMTPVTTASPHLPVLPALPTPFVQ